MLTLKTGAENVYVSDMFWTVESSVEKNSELRSPERISKSAEAPPILSHGIVKRML